MTTSFPSLSQTQAGRAFPLPTIAEDTLHYVLHLPPSLAAEATALLITEYVESLLPRPWIWNRDAWELKVASHSSALSHGQEGNSSKGTGVGVGAKLEGTMRVGDAVDDEWLVVWLLERVSEKWPEIVIGIRDSDGEFLLIEAANELPSWVSPENADNRLWLKDGQLHLIPLTVRSSTKPPSRQATDDESREYDAESWISEDDAIVAVRTGKYRAEGIERAVWDRVACYPDALRTHQHKTKAYLPVPVAKALSQHPELIQRAVEGFYVRDPAQLRAASRMTHFPPSPSILAPVTMTRAAYAQLQGQIFHPPRIFGPEWHIRDDPTLEGERRWRDIGVKISTGFEIMYREGGRKGRGGDAAISEDFDEADGAYTTFLDNLTRAGFFGQELRGSQKWKEREVEARKGYQAVKSTDTASSRPSFAYLVDAAIASSSSIGAEQLAVSSSTSEDSESWLEVSPDELDAMLQRSSGRGKDTQTEVMDQNEKGEVVLGAEHGQALHELAQQVEQFVGGQGDLQGARFEDELSDDDDLMDNDDDDASEDDEEQERQERKKLDAERQSRLDNLIPRLPETEWGQDTLSAQSQVHDIEDETDRRDRMGRRRKADHSDLLPPNMRPPRFTKEHYDGVESDSDDGEVDEADLPPAGTIGRRIALMRWGEGEDRSAKVEEIDEGDAADGDEDAEDKEDRKRRDKLKFSDDLDDEMQRRVWAADEDEEDLPAFADGDEEGLMDVDMLDDQEEFLKFSREALGINDEMWEGILRDRRARGAFVPELSKSKPLLKPFNHNVQLQAANDSDAPPAAAQASSKSSGGKHVNFSSTATAAAAKRTNENGAATAANGVPPPPPEVKGKNASLDSFENVMRAMDAELARQKPTAKVDSKSKAKAKPTAQDSKTTSISLKPSSKPARGNGNSSEPLPPLPTEADLEEMSDDDLLAMDRELRAALKAAGLDEDVEELEEAQGLEGDDKREYEMMRDFLESYQAQGGGSGVVGNLFGRLGK